MYLRHARAIAVGSIALFLGSIATLSAQTAPDALPPPVPPDSSKVIPVSVQIEAGSTLYQPWSSGGHTWHHGKGFIQPIGLIEYYCGKDFPEEKAAAPMPSWLHSYAKSAFGRDDMLFCVYLLNDGDLYIYDNEPGLLSRFDEDHGGAIVETVNVIAGGTGAYKDATGMWVGTIAGRGESFNPPGTQARVPTILLKVMQGYIKIPNSR